MREGVGESREEINCCPKQQSYFVLCTNRPPTRTGIIKKAGSLQQFYKDLYEADMAEKVTEALGAGLLVLNFPC
jgi:hypothetical protein